MNEIKNLIEKISNDNWELHVDEFRTHCKDLIYGPDGARKKILDEINESNEHIKRRSTKKFISNKSLDNIDTEIEIFGEHLKKINLSVNTNLYINFWDYVNKYLEEDNHLKDLLYITNLINSNDLEERIKFRINDLIKELVFQSNNQSNKSKAGSEGEHITECLLIKARLEEGTHYKKQFKSSTGSDTDFVFPYAKDGDEPSVEIFCAVQMSTNDRGRMAASELKAGGEKYLLTYDDFSFSSKTLNDIGTEIINDMKEKGQKLIANSEGINKMINNSTGSKKEFFESRAISIKDFLLKLQNRYLS